ncbi:MAG: phosphopantetheine-binding protein, partial [Verrucomicrobiota bacterium]
TVGELVIHGLGVARGYLGEEPLPAATYHTGDRAWMDDVGRIWFAGREDAQVKIRGQRIDLEEVRRCLRALPGVEDAAAMLSENSRLTAFIATNAVTEEAIREHLSCHLPNAAIPSEFYLLPELTYTADGKLDLQKLRRPPAKPAPAAAEVEERLAAIWEQVLETVDVTADDDFFELGGDSLTSIDLMIQIEKTWGTKLTVEQLRKASGFRDMSGLLQPKQKEERTSEHIFVYNRQGTKTPLIWLHKGVHLAESYDENQPVYLIRDPIPWRIRDRKAEWTPIDQLATELIDEFDRTYPDLENFIFGSHCISSLVAYEMARQWRARGRSISGLILTAPAVPSLDEFRIHSNVNSKPYSPEERKAKPVRGFVQARLPWVWRKIIYLRHLRLHYRRWFNGKVRSARAHRKISRGEELDRLEKHGLEFWCYLQILKELELQTYDGPALVIDGPYRGYDTGSEWRPFFTGDFEFREYPDYGPSLNTDKELDWIRGVIGEFEARVLASP